MTTKAEREFVPQSASGSWVTRVSHPDEVGRPVYQSAPNDLIPGDCFYSGWYGGVPAGGSTDAVTGVATGVGRQPGSAEIGASSYHPVAAGWVWGSPTRPLLARLRGRGTLYARLRGRGTLFARLRGRGTLFARLRGRGTLFAQPAP